MLNPRPNLGAASYSGAAVGKKNSSATLLKLVAGALGIGLVVEPDKEGRGPQLSVSLKVQGMAQQLRRVPGAIC